MIQWSGMHVEFVISEIKTFSSYHSAGPGMCVFSLSHPDKNIYTS
jgi:hypothetical protein